MKAPLLDEVLAAERTMNEGHVAMIKCLAKSPSIPDWDAAMNNFRTVASRASNLRLEYEKSLLTP